MKLLKSDNPALRMISNPILVEEISSKDTQTLVKQLRKFLTKKHGYGIAAPQVGIHKQVIVIRLDKNKELLIVMINPVIKDLSKDFQTFEEGCYSVPGHKGQVTRPRTVTVDYVTPDGIRILQTFTGFNATVIQHEIDHLHGVLFIDKEIK